MKNGKILKTIALVAGLCVGTGALIGSLSGTAAKAEYTDNENHIAFTTDSDSQGIYAPLIYNFALNGNYSVEFDMKILNYGLSVGFGLVVPETEGYQSLAGSNSATVLTDGNSLYLPWNGKVKDEYKNPTAILNYDEGYYNNKMFNKVRVKMEVKDNDLTMYAKSIETEESYPSVCTNPRQAEYVVIAETLTDVVPDDAYFAFFAHSVAADKPVSLYGIKTTTEKGKVLFEDDFSYNYVAASDKYYKTVRFNKALADGAIVLPDAPIVASESKMVVHPGESATSVFADGMIYVNKAIRGACDVSVDMQIGTSSAAANVFLGLYKAPDNSNFYSDPFIQMSQQSIRSSAGGAFDNGAYDEQWWGNRYFNRIRLRMHVLENGTAQFYVTSLAGDEVNSFKNGGTAEEIAALKQALRSEIYVGELSGLFSAYTDGEYYVGMSVRNATDADLNFYRIEIVQDGVCVFSDGFSLTSDRYVISDQITGALQAKKAVLYVAEEKKQEVTVTLPSSVLSTYVGERVDLTPTVRNAAEDAEVVVTVKDAEGNTVQPEEGNGYSFGGQGLYSVVVVVKEGDAVVYENSEEPFFVAVKNLSTQKSANVDFDEGFADAGAWRMSEAGVGILNGELIVAGGEFTTKGFSEICTFTFDVTGISAQTETFSVIFGDAYAFVFDDSETVVLQGADGSRTEFVAGKNVVAALKAGKTSTLRLRLSSSVAELYVRISDESVEVLETPVLKAENVVFVGKVGIRTEGENKIAVDNVSFVNRTSVKDDNTNTDVPKDPEKPVESSSSSEEDSSGTQNKGGCGGCSGTLDGVGLAFGLLAAVGFCLIRTRKERS